MLLADSVPSTKVLAKLANCDVPSPSSPGEEFLLLMWDTWNKHLRYEYLTPFQIMKKARDLVPVNLKFMWQVYNDLSAYKEDVSGYGETNPTALAALALGHIAERLLSYLISTQANELKGVKCVSSEECRW